MIRALEVEPREGLRIWLRFSDGSGGEVDLSDLAGRGVFRAWDRAGAFEEVHVTPHGAVAWNDEIELCGDALYLELTGRSADELARDIVREQARCEVRTFLDALRNGARYYRAIASLGAQVTQEYRGRAILELLQNAHDVLAFAAAADPRRISFVLSSSPEPELLVANSGRPFRRADFMGICQLAQSPKDPNESVGNKGLGFQSVLEISTCPEVWSTAPAGGGPAFTFGFDPQVRDPIGRVARALMDGETPIDSEFGPEPVVDWSEKQVDEYRKRLTEDGTDPMVEVEKLSPYVVPRFRTDPPAVVERLLADGHNTVVRLPLDGGKTGSAEDAVESVREQLRALDEAAMVFLRDLSVLRIEIDGDRVELHRTLDSELPVSFAGRWQRLRVGRSAADAAEATGRSFHVWSRVLGGESDAEGAERIAAAVRHLSNRWPELRQVTISVAVEETREPRQGVFVIFLPTKVKTGVASQVNAPFYGSLDRRQINFKDRYNELLMEFVADLVLDATDELVAGSPEDWRGRAVVDLLAPCQGGGTQTLMERFRRRAENRGRPLEQLALILCDDGWRVSEVARTMPAVPSDDPIGRGKWRGQAGFAVASGALDQRRAAVEALLHSLGGSPEPIDEEWAGTLVRMAECVRSDQANTTWNDFLTSVQSVLPPGLRADPIISGADPLAEAGFLPTEDGRLLSGSDVVRVFFRPRGGADEAADFVGSVPESLKERIAFLHQDVKTHEGPQRRRTDVQKFLDGRFVQSFRREDLLREVVIASLPELPAAHGTPEAVSCAETLAWTLEVIGEEPQKGVVPLLARLPVACGGGWFAMSEAAFGPGWPGSGEHLKALAEGLGGEDGEELLRNVMLAPDDARWGDGGEEGEIREEGVARTEVLARAVLFEVAGVVDGLRLEEHRAMRFKMSDFNRKLPKTAPANVPQSTWDHWRDAVRDQTKPSYSEDFKYELDGVKTLPALLQGNLSDPARAALSDLILASLAHWEDNWVDVTVTKVKIRSRDHHWSRRVDSPLKHWLTTLPWLEEAVDTRATRDGARSLRQNPRSLQRNPKPLGQRWFVPESLLRGQAGRFRHLSPLTAPLANRLAQDEGLLRALRILGLNVYPTEDASTGPALLERLAEVVEAGGPMPAGGFDVLLGQIRNAWRHLGRDRDLPAPIIVRTRPRRLTVRTAEELSDIYLPDDEARTRSLREHQEPFVAMWPEEARGPAGDRLQELGARPASGLEERCLIDGLALARPADGAQTLGTAGLKWLPVVLLALAAHGGRNPRGPTTKAWQSAALRLRRARVRSCNSVRLELLDGARMVAESEPKAHWLPRPGVLVLDREIVERGRWDEAAAAFQSILDRQDLLPYLRLVLGALAENGSSGGPSWEEIEVSLERAEIDASALADIRLRWVGESTLLLERLRPLGQLLGLSEDGLGTDGIDTAQLTAWLAGGLRRLAGGEEAKEVSSARAEALVDVARESYDDFAMGFGAWNLLGEVVALPKWNAALQELGGEYREVTNGRAGEQVVGSLKEAGWLLRAFARHVAMAGPAVSEEDQAALYSGVEAVRKELREEASAGADGSEPCAAWSRCWWEVPFGAVLEVLGARLDGASARPEGSPGIEAVRRHLDVFEGVGTIAEFRDALVTRGVEVEHDPREVARDNVDRLARVWRSVRELHLAWLLGRGLGEGVAAGADSVKDAPPAPGAESYLNRWSEGDLLHRVVDGIEDEEFRKACTECETVDAVRDTLGISREDLDRARKEVRKTARRKGNRTRRRQQTVQVGGRTFEIGGTETYGDLFKHIEGLPEPGGARAPAKLPRRKGLVPGPTGEPRGEITRTGDKTGHLHDNPHLPELIGIVGEMHALRFLRSEFGAKAVDDRAWVSELRTKVLPLLEGEEDVTSDSLGYDFRFVHDGTTWCIEVKATTEDSTSFCLTAGEMAAARRIAARKDERWRILRVRRAFNEQPESDWLPNPFEPGAGELLRLGEGGVKVKYALSDAAAGPKVRQ